MNLVEVPVRTLTDEVFALENSCASQEEILFASGAIAALAWLADPRNPSPFIAMHQQLGQKAKH